MIPPTTQANRAESAQKQPKNQLLRRRTLNKKELIRQAAIKVIAEEGFFSSTTDRIAKEAGIAVGTVYNYFSSKEDILNYIFETEYEIRSRFFSAMKDEKIHSLDKIMKILKMHFDEFTKNPAVGIVILRERRFGRKRPLEGIRQYEGLPEFFKKILGEGITAGEIVECDVDLVASLIFGMVEAVMEKCISIDASSMKRDVQDALKEVANLLRYGLVSETS
jgi:TetR/AcrR family fatty acid metabolism transcriptional regulator